ncbi:MAG TPA: glycosyltransferase family 39 protein, partial [Polyangiaceae bacterium]|nr:glycosyltransferase family 39 protein [Polyangiaceae bacterium]
MSEENAGASGAETPSNQENPEKSRPIVSAARNGTALLAWFAVIVAALSLFAPLASSGIWDPPEREVAELARRVAVNLLGGHGLVVQGSNNEVPTRSELARGELPFTSIAAGFRAFGLHEWAGRLPLAIWGAVGLLAVYLLVSRLSDRRSAWFSVLVLSTMPLYFVHARTMLGDIVTMAALALALCGLGLSVFDRGSGEGQASRVLFLGVGLLGMACATLSRGVLVGIAVPALSVGVTWFALRRAGVTPAERFGDALGALSLVAGLVAGFVACRALYLAPSSAGPFSLLLGSAVNRPRVLPTFDSVLLQLGHALFPWSAVLPVALGALLRPPPIAAGPAREREAALRVLVLALPVLAWLAYGIAEPVVGSMPFAGVAALAIAVALFARDFERGAQSSRAVPMIVCAFAILLLVDFKNFPEKGLSAFCVVDAHFPESFKPTAERLLEAGTLLFCAAFFFLLQERSSHADDRFEPSEYRAWPRVLQKLWAGNLQFALLVLEAALLGLCALGLLGDRLQSLRQVDALGATPRSAALLGACVLPLLLVSPSLLTLVRDAFRTVFDPELGSLFEGGVLSRWLAGGLSRGQAALFCGVGFGLCLSLGYYPMLAAQISPKQVFEAYRRDAKPGEELGMLGAGASSASYYAGRTVPSFDTGVHAFEWLSASQERRWLVIRASDLALLNGLYRARTNPARNLPVLDARSSEILLVSNQLGGAHNDNPLSRFILERAPEPGHPLDANLDNKLDVLGWDVLDLAGHPASAVEAGRHYSFVIYYRVVQPITGSWETFIHIDGFQRRFNGDHPTLGGKYPFNLWRVGDFISDRYDFALEPNFGAGKYKVYFGLYSGNRRLDVRRGSAEEN